MVVCCGIVVAINLHQLQCGIMVIVDWHCVKCILRASAAQRVRGHRVLALHHL